MYTISAADLDTLHEALHTISRINQRLTKIMGEDIFREMCKAQAMIDRVTRHATREK